MKAQITSSCVDFISKKMDKSDLFLLRNYLKNKDSSLGISIICYMNKFGEFNDISLLCHVNKNNSLLNNNNGDLHNKLAETIVKLGNGRESEVLDMDIPNHLKIKIIAHMRSQKFNNFSNLYIKNLLNNEDVGIREKVCMKLIESFPKKRISIILNEYTLQKQHYYNVVHWIDFGINVNTKIAQVAVKKALAASLTN